MKRVSNLANWRPTTRTGWWAIGLAAVYFIMMVLNNAVLMRLPVDVPWRMTVLPVYAIAMIACGAAAGILGLIAVIWGKERSSLVWLPIMFMLLVIVMLLGELIIPH